jgi:threonyl-tRNA synthetase
VLIHRSVLGSMEWLFGHLIEVHNGAFPAWYAPVQLVVLPVSPAEIEAAQRFAEAAGDLRVELHAEGSLGARVRDARRVPFVAVIRPREAAADAVSLRPRGPEPVVRPAAEALAAVRAGCGATRTGAWI